MAGAQPPTDERSPVPTPEPISREAQIRMAPSVLKIEAINQGGNYSIGSGVLVGPHIVVTNCHVTRRAQSISVLQGGDRHPAVAQAGDVQHDLCALQVPEVQGTPVEIAGPAHARLGEPVIGIGFSGGLGLQFTQGELESLYRFDGSEVLRSSNFFTSGASGGGLFDAQGSLLGLMTFRLRGGEAHYFSVPADWIRSLIADAGSFKPVAPLDGQAFWEIDPDHQAFFLRAASLAQGAQWSALARVAREWARQIPPESAASLALADALEHEDDLAGAASALEQATGLAPEDAEAWWRRGQLLTRMGRLEEARAVRVKLQGLDSARAQRLTQLLETH